MAVSPALDSVLPAPLRDGRVVAGGPLADVLTDEALSEAFGLPLTVEHRDGRWYARRNDRWVEVEGVDIR